MDLKNSQTKELKQIYLEIMQIVLVVVLNCHMHTKLLPKITGERKFNSMDPG